MPKALKVLICVLLAGALTYMVFLIAENQRESQARAEHISALASEAKSYETELMRLKREQEVQEMKLYEPDGPGAAVIAFRLGGEETLELVKLYAEQYRFQPSLLVNVDDEDAAEMLELAADSGWDVIFSSLGFDEKLGTRLKSLMRQAEDLGLGNTHAYLLRASCDTDANRAVLSRAGIRTLFLYGEGLESRVTEEFTELNFSYVNRNEYTPTNRLSGLSGSEQGLLFAVDLKETKITEHQLGEILSLISQDAEYGHIRICSTAEAVKTVQERIEREESRINEFESANEDRNARIAELEEKIRDIYSQWDK